MLPNDTASETSQSDTAPEQRKPVRQFIKPDDCYINIKHTQQTITLPRAEAERMLEEMKNG